MKVLLTTPFYQKAGGSELETSHTANTLASFDIVNEVHVFVYAGYDIKFTRDIEINSKVKFFRRPKILDNKYLNKLNKEFKKFFNLDLLPFDVLYWKLIFFTNYDGLKNSGISSFGNDIPYIDDSWFPSWINKQGGKKQEKMATF